MRITDIHIEGFGVWHDLTIGRISTEVTAFYGPNEAGKTTLMQFLRSVLYGMSADRRKRYLPPFAGGRPGGWLKVDGEDGPLQINRIADRGPTDVGKVTVKTSDDNEHGDRLLREALEHVDEVTYSNVFAVGLRDIQELGALSGTAAAQWLYRLTSGLDRVSLYDVIHLLRGSLVRILNVPDERSELRDLVTRRDALHGELEELMAKGRRWAQSAVKLGELADEIQQLQVDSKRFVAEARTLETSINLKPLWIKRQGLDEEITTYQGLYKLSDTAVAELDELNERIEEHQRQRDIQKGQRHQLRAEAEGLGINELLVVNSARLEGLQEQQEWLEALARQADELDADVEELDARLTNEHEVIVNRWLTDGAGVHHVTPEVLEQLEPQVKAITATERLVEQAREEVNSYRHSELQVRTKLESAAASSDKLGLPADIQQVNDLIAGLEERQQVQQQVEKCHRDIRELEQQNFELCESQLMSMDWFLFLLGSMVVSCVLVGARVLGWLESDSPLGTFAAWAGPIGILSVCFAVFWKYASQRLSEDRLDDWAIEREDAERQLQKAMRDQKRLGTDTKQGEGSVSLRLEQARRHLAELEKTLPVESKRREVVKEIEAAETRLKQAEQKRQAALDNWKSKLRGLGLSANVTPADLQSIAGQYHQLDHLRERCSARREDAHRCRRDLDTICRRVHNLAEETGLLDEELEPLDLLEHMLEVQREQKARLAHRDGLYERAKELKAEEARHARAAVGLGRRRDALFQQCGVDGEKAFRHLAEQHVRCAQLVEKRKAVTREIAAAIGRGNSEDDFALLMAPEMIGRLEHNWEALTARIEELDGQLKQLLEQRGRLVEQQRRLADDRSLAHKQMEIDEVDQKIRLAKKAWRERAVVYHMLERIRDEYEKNRQPETLLEASQYMRQLTSGRYTRVWTPLANDVLFVEQSDGQSLPVEVLSTGTREQLYVSLRMAMVAMFARRGITLPMILDDVFVNFDVGRTRIAIDVMQNFAREGHQLLVFTCHEHVWRMFQEVNADARRLPDRFSGALPDLDPVEEEVFDEEVEPLDVIEEEPPAPKPKRKRKKRKPTPPPVETVAEPLPEFAYGEVADKPEPLPEYVYAAPPIEKPIEVPVEVPITSEVEYVWPEDPEPFEAYRLTDWDGNDRPLLDPIVSPLVSLDRSA
jgi:uncharacterized protein YhaN